jgi:hypothetical protein
MGKSVWPTRLQEAAAPPKACLFPLPSLDPPSGPELWSKISRRTYRKRLQMWIAANEAIDALNSMYGVSDPLCVAKDELSRSAHASVHSNILSSVAGSIPSHVQKSRSAFHELAGVTHDYGGEATSVEPYNSNTILSPYLMARSRRSSCQEFCPRRHGMPFSSTIFLPMTR